MLSRVHYNRRSSTDFLVPFVYLQHAFFMVSQPEQPTSLLRGYSSVASRSTISRSKRYNRSHAGGASYIAQNEFPVFSNSGDVEIIVKAGGYENRYVLHRHILARCSGFFEVSTSEVWSKALPEARDTSALARIAQESDATDSGSRAAASPSVNHNTSRTRWRYELDPGVDEGDMPMLVQRSGLDPRKDEDTSQPASLFGLGSAQHQSYSDGSFALALNKSSPACRSVANLTSAHAGAQPLVQADHDVLFQYRNLFLIFYNYAPVLDAVNIADAYVQCKSLLALADQYDALAVVGPRVEHHLLQFCSRLWKQIAKYPVSYLRLGYLAQSRVVFQEALVHVVGQWPVGERSLRAALPGIVLDIIEDKVDELDDTVSRVEGRLFRLTLKTSRGDNVSPSTSYLDWLAVSLFRQWLADNTGPPEPKRRATNRDREAVQSSPASVPSSGMSCVGRAFRTMGSLNLAGYLAHDECKKFLKLSPELYTSDNLRRFEKRVEEVKSLAREVVRPLMGSVLELDASVPSKGSDGIPYLTCTTVCDRDLPWLLE